MESYFNAVSDSSNHIGRYSISDELRPFN